MLKDTGKFRELLLARKDELTALRASSAENRKPIALDQQSVGRLSRMDSLQVQAMDNAAEARRQLDLRRTEAALQRIEDDEYGYCLTCADEIPDTRLEVDPAAAQCTTCAK